jgi:hypothetical protein
MMGCFETGKQVFPFFIVFIEIDWGDNTDAIIAKSMMSGSNTFTLPATIFFLAFRQNRPTTRY